MATRKVFLALALLCFCMYSQGQFKPGWLISNTGDTIKGEIAHKNWNLTPKEIRFRSGADAAIQVINPSDIRAFMVADNHYTSSVVTVEESPRKDNSLSEEGDLLLTRQHVFLEKIVSGQKSLYFYRDAMGHEHFYINRGDSIEWLTYKKFLLNTGTAFVIAYNNRFRDQLDQYFGDCSSIKKQTADAKYRLGDLTRVFRKYYECTSQQPVHVVKEVKEKPRFGFFAGASSTAIKFKTSASDVPYLTVPEYPSSVNPAFGGFFEFFLNRKGKNIFSINNEVMYTAYQTEGHYEEYETPDRYEIHDIRLKMAYLKLNNLLRYNIRSANNNTLFLTAGISNGFAISAENYHRKERFLYTSTTITEGEILAGSRKYEQSFLLGGGYLWKNWGAEIRFEKGNGISEVSAIKTPVTRLFLLLRYSL